MIEVFAVMIIAAILIGLILISFGSVRDEGLDTRIKSSIRQMRILSEDIYGSERSYESAICIIQEGSEIMPEHEEFLQLCEDLKENLKAEGETFVNGNELTWCGSASLRTDEIFCMDSSGATSTGDSVCREDEGGYQCYLP